MALNQIQGKVTCGVPQGSTFGPILFYFPQMTCPL